MSRVLPCLLLSGLLLSASPGHAANPQAPAEKFQYAPTRSADGFDMPVGKPEATGFYRSRGLIPGRHMGDDWNGNGGGNTDLGAPVYITAHGLVVFAKDARMGWGNLVIVRHVYWQKGRWNYADSVYAHLNQISVREGQQVRRGQFVGTIGTNRGMYAAHLHFEIRRNLRIGANQGSYGKDLNNYYKPYDFISTHRNVEGGNRRVNVPINTFRLHTEPVDAMHSSGSSPSTGSRQPSTPKGKTKGEFRVNRYN